MAKLWGGRFKQGLEASAKQFSYGLDVDSVLVHYDILVNKAHAKALTEAGIFTADEFNKVTACLDDLDAVFEQNPEELLGDDEDIHSCIERLVTERLGDLGKKLHTGKSRNDQVITDFRLYVKDACNDLGDAAEALIVSLCQLAEKNIELPFPGFTHLQTAQPVLVAHHLLAYVEKFMRDIERLSKTYDTADVCPLGSAALAGNNYGLDRELIAEELGFSAMTLNSMDAVSDRDFAFELAFACNVMMTHLSRLADELILWSSPLTGFIEIGDGFTTGSSIMPQKKNPDIAELIRGKSARVQGNLTALFHLVKGLPLTYNRDLQKDKELVFDSVDTVYEALDCMAGMLETVTFNPDKIDAALKQGYSLATEFADYLVKKGIPFREAHEITGAVVLDAVEKKQPMESLSLEALQVFDKRIEADVFACLNVEAAINAKNVLGGTASLQVKAQLNELKEQFKW
jgi:argininosuccinate lyase